MNDLDKLIEDIDSETSLALITAIRDIVVSYQKFHESTVGSMLSEETQRQRKVLLSTSLFAYLITWAGMLPTKISWLGIELSNINVSVIYAGMAAILGYLFRSFFWRADLEFTNSKIQRKNLSLLHKIECKVAMTNLREKNQDLADFIYSELVHNLLFDDKKDPYRESIMGLNFRSSFFELRLPHIVSTGAVISCIFFMISS